MAQCKSLLTVVGVLIAAFAGGACVQWIGMSHAPAYAQDALPGEIRATSLVIVGEDGTERARLGAYEDGYGLVLRDSEGVARAMLSLVNLEDGVALALHDPAGLRRFYMGPGPDGGGLEIVDPRGNTRFGFGEGPDGGALQIGDPQGNTRFSFGEGRDGGGLQISDPEGNTRFSFGNGPGGSGLQVLDAVGNKRFEASHTDTDGGMRVFDWAGNTRFEVFDGGEWLGMTFRDVEGVDRAGLRMGPDGESDLFVTGGATEWAASACPQ